MSAYHLPLLLPLFLFNSLAGMPSVKNDHSRPFAVATVKCSLLSLTFAVSKT